MIVLGLDVETTGLSSVKDDIIEIGAVLWDTEKGVPLIIESINVKTDLTITDFITNLTGIDQVHNSLYGEGPEEVIKRLEPLIRSCDYFVAHNAQFDKRFLEAYFSKYEKGWNLEHLQTKQWIDTKTDLPKEAYGKSKGLSKLAAKNGITNPFAHRAVFDVLTMLSVLQKFASQLDLASEKVCLEAVVSFEEKDVARKAGFYWNPEQKVWWKVEVKQNKYSYDFEVIEKPVEEAPI